MEDPRPIRDHDMELAMRPLPDAWETLMGRDPDAPRIISIGNPDGPQDSFRQRMQEAGAAAAASGFGRVVAGVPYPTFEEPRDPGVMRVPTVAASEAIDMADLFGDELGDLRFRDATSPTDAARARARAKRRKTKRRR